VKSLRGRLEHKFSENIKMDLREVVFLSVDWIQLARSRVKMRNIVNTAVKLKAP
jgi:hypothetical protein